MRLLLRPAIISLAVAAVFALSTPAHAQVDVGVRGGYYFDIGEPFVGAELLLPVVDRKIFFNPNVEYVFVEDLNYMTFNFDFHYDLPVHGPQFVWLGAGLGLVRVDPEGPGNSDTDPALNVLAGVGFRAGGTVPYFQAKLIVRDNTEFALAFGVRF